MYIFVSSMDNMPKYARLVDLRKIFDKKKKQPKYANVIPVFSDEDDDTQEMAVEMEFVVKFCVINVSQYTV